MQVCTRMIGPLFGSKAVPAVRCSCGLNEMIYRRAARSFLAVGSPFHLSQQTSNTLLALLYTCRARLSPKGVSPRPFSMHTLHIHRTFELECKQSTTVPPLTLLLLNLQSSTLQCSRLQLENSQSVTTESEKLQLLNSESLIVRFLPLQLLRRQSVIMAPLGRLRLDRVWSVKRA